MPSLRNVSRHQQKSKEEATAMKDVIYGWRQGIVKKDESIEFGGPSEPLLFVYQNPKGWGVTKDKTNAARFPDVAACQAHYLSKLAYPDQYVKSLTNGYLEFYDISGQKLLPF
jgi:hypothetical protein